MKLEIEFSVACLYSVEQACRDINRLMRRVSTDNLDGFHTISSSVKGNGGLLLRFELMGLNLTYISMYFMNSWMNLCGYVCIRDCNLLLSHKFQFQLHYWFKFQL